MAISSLILGTANEATNGNTTPVIPAGAKVDNQLMVLLDVVVRDRTTSTPATPTTPAGWLREVTNVSIAGAMAHASIRIGWYYRRYVAGDADPSVVYGPTGVTTDQHWSQIIGVPGALSSGDPTDVLGTFAVSGSSVTNSIGPAPGAGALATDGGLILACAVAERALTSGAVPTLTGDSLTWVEAAERIGSAAAIQNDWSMFFDYALVPTARTITDKSAAVTRATGFSVGHQWALKAEPAAQPGDFFPFFTNG